MGKSKNDMGVYDHSDIKVGDIVIVDGQGCALRSTSTWYPLAICVATLPLLTLVSEDGEAKWSAALPDMPLRAVGRAKPEQMAAANLRYHADRKQELEAEAKTTLAGINIVYRTQWTEYEFGQRPDGVSYSPDLDALKAYIQRIESLGSRECFNRASDITQAIVTPEFYAEIVATPNKVYTTDKHDHDGMIGTFRKR